MAGHENLAAALAAFQAELPKLHATETAKVKTRTGGEYEYRYADLAEVTERVSPILGKHGLSFNSRPTVVGQTFGLVYELRHEGGEKDEGFWPLPSPRDTPAQEIGSAITYARRYCFLAVTNTFPSGGADDDGRAASDRPAREERPRQERQQRGTRGRQERQEQPAAEQPAQQARQEQKTWTDAEVGEQHYKLSTLELDKAVKLYDWMAGKSLHGRTIGDTTQGDQPRNATEVLAIRLADTATAPDGTIPQIGELRSIAEDRGLLKVQVSETETLDEVLASVRAIRNAANLDTDNAAALRDAAAASYGDE